MICWDCQQDTSDYVMESRQVSGGDGVVYAGDFKDVPVHNNRRACQAAKQKSMICRKCGTIGKGSMWVLKDERGQRVLEHSNCPPEARFTGFDNITIIERKDS